MKNFLLLTLLGGFLVGLSYSGEFRSLNIEETGVYKGKLLAVFQAMGAPPRGYSMERESFYLPAKFDPTGPNASFYLQEASAQRQFGAGQEKFIQEQQAALKNFEATLLDKMTKDFAKATAAGNDAKVRQIQQEHHEKISEYVKQANEKYKRHMEETSKDGVPAADVMPIDIVVRLNNRYHSEEIRPNALVFAKPGVIALRSISNGDVYIGSHEVHVYFDPVAFQDFANVTNTRMRFFPSSQKTAVLNVDIELIGPPDLIETWAQQIDADAILAQVDR